MTRSPDPAASRDDSDRSSPAALRARKDGEGVEPGLSLDALVSSAPDSTPSSASTKLLRRLSDHSLGQSRYTLQGEIARGGMGAILKVWDEDLRRTLAMKVMLGKADSPAEASVPDVDSRTLGRFLEEAQVTGQLDHPGIAPVHELGLDAEGRVFFTMKLVKGRDLKHIFDLVFSGKENWNETRALSVMLKVCEALAYAHSKGVIHRDLKPANVMVGNFGEVYVMDWGLARVLGRKDRHDIRLRDQFASSLGSIKTERRAEREDAPDSPLVTMDGDVMGTPAYMPLEQAQGEIEKLSPRSDVYAIGAMLYHLLARQLPYLAPRARISNRTVLAMVLHGPPVALTSLRKDVPAELVAICEKAMARDAAQRYPDTLALAEDLRAYLEHRVVHAYETGAWAEARKWVERNKPLAAALVGVVVLLVSGLTASLVFKARADEKAAEATRQKRDVLKLSALQTLDDLTKEADGLWPAEPDRVESYRVWMKKAEELLAKLPDFRSSLAEIEQRALPQALIESGEREQLDPKLAAQDAETPRPREWRFAEDTDGAQTGDRWWHDQMLKLVAALESLGDPKTGLMHGVSEAHGWGIAQRLEFAESVEVRTLGGEDAKQLWSAAIAAIGSSAKYGGLTLTPELGLLPMGVDPESGLWEFAHVQSGELAQRGTDGKLLLKGTTGLVFVLIPGGTFWMGAQKTDPNARNYDPQANDDESPVHEVLLSPYFLPKYEMTQGQWERCAGRNPSTYGPSTKENGHQHDLTHPVEQVSWTACASCMGRLGLMLPSEAQWEYGCRGGKDTPWWTGAERESLRGHVNIADLTASRAGATWSDIKDWPDLEDGWMLHAPVGSFPANPYGLHEVAGNVWEWCRDGWGNYQADKQLDPVKPASGTQPRVIRGGCFSRAATTARSAYRYNYAPGYQNGFLGLRPARAVQLSAPQTQPRAK